MASTGALTMGDVLHRLVENSPGAFTPEERVQAHEAITDGHGGDRHFLVPDPDDPDAGRQDAEPTEVDQRDTELARLRAELQQERADREQERADRDRERAEAATAEPEPASSPDLADSPGPANGKHATKG